MLIQLSGPFIIDPGHSPRRLLIELETGAGFSGSDHPECGVFSGQHDGFENPEEMNQRIPGVPIDEEVPWIQRFEIQAPHNRAPMHQRRGYHYVAISWNGGVYAAYPVPTEIMLEDSEGSWSVCIGRRGSDGVRVVMPDYAPWDLEEGQP